jgi:hypothetical protein
MQKTFAFAATPKVKPDGPETLFAEKFSELSIFGSVFVAQEPMAQHHQRPRISHRSSEYSLQGQTVGMYLQRTLIHISLPSFKSVNGYTLLVISY